MAGGDEASCGGSAGAFSLSFKGKTKGAVPKLAVQPKAELEKRELVTGISGTSLKTLEKKEKAEPLVIPRLENTFKVGVGKTAAAVTVTTKAQRAREQRFLPVVEDGLNSKTEDKFELAEDVPVDVSIGYGLTKFEKKGPAVGAGKGGETALSQLMTSQQDKEAQLMKEDLLRLPEQASIEAYEAMPIAKFGEAMLRGMGWKDGMNVGRNQSSVVQAVEYVSRPGRLGLGAQPSTANPKEKKYIRPGESREPKADLVLARGADGRQRNVRTLDEKPVKRTEPGAQKGKVMWLAAGEHRGLFCTVLDVRASEGIAVVRLKPSDADVAVAVKDMVEDWEREEVEAARAHGASSERTHKRERSSGDNHRKDRHREKERDRENEKNRDHRHREEDRKHDRDRPSKRSRQDFSPPRHRNPSWLASNIRVRLIDKRLGGGKFYLRKATLLDVTAPGECCVRIDDSGETVQDVRESQLETLVPKSQGIRVLILAGEHRGQKGRLLQRNTATGAAAVQLMADFSVVKLPLDDISEYVGPESEYD